MNTPYKGYLALDIDGTVTAERHQIPQIVRDYLKSLYQEGWLILFVTGRTFTYGITPLLELDFPYYLAVQNGADIIQMPSREVVFRSYMPKEVIPILEEIYHTHDEHFLIYSGYEMGDFCYFNEKRFSHFLQDHFNILKDFSSQPWVNLPNLNSVPQAAFPLIKTFGKEGVMDEIQKRLDEEADYTFSIIRNPFLEENLMGLLTSAEASKGHAVEWIMENYGYKLPLIAAGDDRNDVSMLEKADVAIVMESAPHDVLRRGHVIAPRAEKQGIIQGIKQAIEKL